MNRKLAQLIIEVAQYLYCRGRVIVSVMLRNRTYTEAKAILGLALAFDSVLDGSSQNRQLRLVGQAHSLMSES